MVGFDFYSFCLGLKVSIPLILKIIISLTVLSLSVLCPSLSFFILQRIDLLSLMPLKCPFHYFLFLKFAASLMPWTLPSSLLSLQSRSIDTSSFHWILISKDYAFHLRASALPLFKSLSLANTVPLSLLSCAVVWSLWSMQTGSVSRLWEPLYSLLLCQLSCCSSLGRGL